MKTNHINLKIGANGRKEITLKPREISLMLGRITLSNIRAGIRHAVQILESSADFKDANVLYINTVQTVWKLSDTIRKVTQEDESYTGAYHTSKDKKRQLFFMTADIGELYKKKEIIKDYIRSQNVRTVIINSWEFAAKDSRSREALLHLLRDVTNGDLQPKFDRGEETYFVYDHLPASVLIYAEETTSLPEAEKIQKRGFGKLAAMIDQVVKLDDHEELQAAVQEQANSTMETPKKKVIILNEPLKKEEAVIPSPMMDIPVTSIEELRNTPASISKMPIQYNNFSPDKPAIQRAERMGALNEVIKK
jgi:hypothetical protein